MRNVWTIAWTTYNDTTRRPLYYILLAVFSVLIYCSHFLTLFTFNAEANMVREMGMASLALFGFLIFVILTPVLVTSELEDRTAITLLAKPVTRTAFLLGKYAGLVLAVAMGTLVLAGVLFYTLWWMSRGELFGAEPGIALRCLLAGLAVTAGAVVMNVRGARKGVYEGRNDLRIAFALYAIGVVLLILAATFSSGSRDRADVLWQTVTFKKSSVWDIVGAFMRENGIIVIEGILLSVLQVGLLGAICVALAAFVPGVVSVAATGLAFILGNLASYLLAGFESSSSGLIRALGRGVYYLLPNLGYFNLQTHFSEGSIVAPGYLALAFVHAVLYVSIVFLIACTLFERREIR